MCIVEIHEMNMVEYYFHQQNKDRIKANEDLQPRTKPVETHYKNTYFCTYRDKNGFSRKLKDRFPPPIFQCCLR